jgi:plasmid maintenance system antidote protein VapI
MAFLLGECQLQSLLKRANMKPAEFARQMECSRTYVSDLISGDKTMSLEFAINAAYILDCEVNELYALRRSGSRKG